MIDPVGLTALTLAHASGAASFDQSLCIPTASETEVPSQERCLDLIFKVGAGPYALPLVESVFSINLPDSSRESLFQAFLHRPNPGSLDHLYTAKAIKDLFIFSDLLDAPDGAGLANLLASLHRALSQDNQARRMEELEEVFRFMETGRSDFADTVEVVSSLRTIGLPHEEISRRLNGTPHTASLNDLRLARRVVAVSLEASYYLNEGGTEREEARSRLIKRILGHVDDPARQGRLTPEDLLDFLTLGDTSEDRSLREQLNDPRLVLLIKPQREFDEKVAASRGVVGGESPDGCRNALFRRLPATDQPDEIWIAKVIPSSRQDTFHEIARRIVSVPHELAHWRDIHGLYEGIEAGSKPIRPSRNDWREHLVWEIMAGLWEQRWRMRNHDVDAWIIARRLGLTMAQHQKLIAMWGYRRRSGV